MYTIVNNNLGLTENHLKVLSLFTCGYNKEFYIREVNRKLGVSPRTAQLVLETLESKGVLLSSMRGKIKSYSLRKNQGTRYYLILSEAYKTTLFMENNSMIKEITEKILPFISGIGVIFGSYAKGTETKDSDIDIFVAGNAEAKKIKEISKIYGVDINLVVYPLEKFKSLIDKGIFLREVLENHIIISSIDLFVSMVLENEDQSH
ncbi:MAG TPA: nucleotidyltransferase domain-containing protein [Methanofastidiosum sp.]|jgi:predicted nucleotidyltransferase|nr:nucleotidyltransferase domain-containing protein [Methanofastidiosum sp.]HPA49599.1 nucleotidyltransferase domain-containing protein [Methanofastidiosum sp.]HQQ49497.1 nucleotidyltransferase domain-containing protein [Methanofastidiosum sp.]